MPPFLSLHAVAANPGTTAAALGEERDVTGGRRARHERRVERHPRRGVQDAQAVRADQPHAMAPADLHQLALTAHAGGTDLREARGDHDEAPHAGGSTLPRRIKHGDRGDRDDGQLDGFGKLAHRVEGGHRLHRGRRGVG